MRMNAKSGGGQARLDDPEGCLHVRCPGEGMGIAGQGISKRAEDGGGVGHETTVKVD